MDSMKRDARGSGFVDKLIVPRAEKKIRKERSNKPIVGVGDDENASNLSGGIATAGGIGASIIGALDTDPNIGAADYAKNGISMAATGATVGGPVGAGVGLAVGLGMTAFQQAQQEELEKQKNQAQGLAIGQARASMQGFVDGGEVKPAPVKIKESGVYDPYALMKSMRMGDMRKGAPIDTSWNNPVDPTLKEFNNKLIPNQGKIDIGIVGDPNNLLPKDLQGKVGMFKGGQVTSPNVEKGKQAVNRQGLAVGGPVEGAGTGTSDDVEAKLNPGDFVVPASNAKIAEQLRQMYFGKSDEVTHGDKKGTAPVALSNGEHVFTKAEADVLKQNGINLDMLAPNAEKTGYGYYKGGPIKGKNSEVKHSVYTSNKPDENQESFERKKWAPKIEELYKNPNVRAYLNGIMHGETDPKNAAEGKNPTSSAKGYFQFLKGINKAIKDKYGYEGQNKDIAESAKAAIALMIDNGAADSIAKGDFEAADKRLKTVWTSLPGGKESNVKSDSIPQIRKEFLENKGEIKSVPGAKTYIPYEDPTNAKSTKNPDGKTGVVVSAQSYSKNPMNRNRFIETSDEELPVAGVAATAAKKDSNIVKGDDPELTRKYGKVEDFSLDVFAKKVLEKIGAPTTEKNIQSLKEWAKAEGNVDGKRARYNPFNTSLKTSTAVGDFNSHNVKHYQNFDAGVQATADTLLDKKGRYKDVVEKLKNESDVSEVKDAIERSPWGTDFGNRSKYYDEKGNPKEGAIVPSPTSESSATPKITSAETKAVAQTQKVEPSKYKAGDLHASKKRIDELQKKLKDQGNVVDIDYKNGKVASTFRGEKTTSAPLNPKYTTSDEEFSADMKALEAEVQRFKDIDDNNKKSNPDLAKKEEEKKNLSELQMAVERNKKYQKEKLVDIQLKLNEAKKRKDSPSKTAYIQELEAKHKEELQKYMDVSDSTKYAKQTSKNEGAAPYAAGQGSSGYVYTGVKNEPNPDDINKSKGEIVIPAPPADPIKRKDYGIPGGPTEREDLSGLEKAPSNDGTGGIQGLIDKQLGERNIRTEPNKYEGKHVMAPSQDIEDPEVSLFSKLGEYGGLFALGQTAMGLAGLASSKDPGTYPGDPNLSTQLGQAQLDATRLNPAVRANAETNLELTRRTRNAEASRMSAGDVGLAMGASRESAIDKNRGIMGLAQLEEQTQQSKLARVDQRVDALSADKGKVWDSKNQRFIMNQEASAGLLNTGITNFIGAQNYSKYMRDLGQAQNQGITAAIGQGFKDLAETYKPQK
ncbi:MAG: hypothetical protein KAY50_00545 [Chitinophagaceae bacterium]|nr:hypothetical protein [Chitinophagaceae bacterium]